MNVFDYIIVGAGPTGIALAWYLSKNNKVLLVEKENAIGGCHKANRVKDNNNIFTEHGPRVYLDNYYQTIELLSDMNKSLGKMNYKFTDDFVKYRSSISSIIDTIGNITILEYLNLVKGFFGYILIGNKNDYLNYSVYEFMIENNFSQNSIEFIDYLCRFIDGGDSTRFTMYEFYEFFIKSINVNLYLPKLPTDIGIFKTISNALVLQKNITLMTNTEILSFKQQNTSEYVSVKTQETILYGKNLLFAIPLQSLDSILQNCDNPERKAFDKSIFTFHNKINKEMQKKTENIPLNSFQSSKNNLTFSDFVKLTNYHIYIPVVFYWKKKFDLPQPNYHRTEWNIGSIPLSNYTQINGTMISSAIMERNVKSDILNLTANEVMISDILIQETFRQLNLTYNNQLPVPDKMILSSDAFYQNSNEIISGKNGEWKTKTSSFMLTKYGYLHYTSKLDNVYSIGPHNGMSDYPFTTMESAIGNAIEFLKIENSELFENHNHLTQIKTFINTHKLLILFSTGILLVYCALCKKYNINMFSKKGIALLLILLPFAPP